MRPALPIVQHFVLASTDSLRLGDWEPSAHTKVKKNVKRLRKKEGTVKKKDCPFERSWSTTSSDNFKGRTQRALVVKNAAREISTHRKSWPWTVESQSRRFSRHLPLAQKLLAVTISGNVRARTIRHQTAPPIRITALQYSSKQIYPHLQKKDCSSRWDFSASHPNDAVGSAPT